jgi:hypothetical protein
VGVVDEYIDSSESFHRLVNHSLDLFSGTDVAGKRQRLSALGDNLVRCPNAFLKRASNHHSRRAFRSQRARNSASDALTSARDNRNFAYQHSTALLRSVS